MSSIDERIVQMKFNNSQFESGVKKTMDSLDGLKKGLNLDAAKASLAGLATAGKNFTLAGIDAGVQGVSTKFLALATIGITALSNIANQAINTGKQVIDSLTIDPIKAGFAEYELKMGSIQTILANTSRYGTTLGEVTSALDELNAYADKTIYNFGSMTKNIGLFTNAGIRIEDATSMIKGFSNAAAASGTSAEGAAGAAYQLSQALSSGKITLMDWRSLTNVGMGNKNMQTGIIEIADAMGTLKEAELDASTVQADFNGSLEKGWLKADVMSTYLKIMAGDMDATAMSALGLSDSVITTFLEQQKTAEEAATKVRTFTQLMDTLKEAVGSSWAQSFDMLIGDFDQATVLFSNVSSVLGKLIGATGDARNKLIEGWITFGGRDMAIEAITNAFTALMSIVRIIGRAFEQIFPAITVKNLINMTQAIVRFSEGLLVTGASADRLQRIFAGVFAIFGIGWEILKGFVTMLMDVLGVATESTGGILDFSAGIGDFLVKVHEAIKNGNGLTKFFEKLGNVIKAVLRFREALISVVFNWFDVDSFAEAWQNVVSVFQAIGQFVKPVVDWFAGGLKSAGDAIKEFFSSLNPSLGAGLLGAGIVAGVFMALKIALGKIPGLLKQFDLSSILGGGLVDSIKGVFGQLTSTMSAMQDKLKAEALMKIAIAIGLLTVSVIALSFVDPVKLAASLGAITVMFGQLMGAMVVMDKVTSSKGFAKMPLLTASMIALAAAMVLLSVAVLILSTMDWNELARGLTGLGVALGIVVGALTIMPKNLIFTGAGLILAALGIAALAGALKILGTMSWDEIGRSMTLLGSSLAILAVGLTLMTGTIVGSAALVIAAVAIVLLAGALKVMSLLSWDEIGRSMTLLGSSLAILALGLTLMTASIPGAAALVIASVALLVLGGALKILGSLSWDEIGRAMGALGYSLGILAIGLTLMIAALPGALALTVAAGALAVLAPVLLLLGSMSWEQIGTGLGALASALGILALAGMLLIPALPGLIGLGVAIMLLGVGALAAGVGIGLFAIGLAAMAAAGAGAIAMIGPAIEAFAAKIPLIAAKIGEGIIAFAGVIATNGTAMTEAFVAILMSLINAIVTLIPTIVNAAVVLIIALVNAIVKLVPFLVDAGMKLIIGVLDGVQKNLGKVISKGTDVIVALLDGIGKAIPRLLQAGAQLILDFVNGIANTIRANTSKFNAAGSNLASAIIEGMTSGIRNGVGNVIRAITGIAGGAIAAAKRALGIASPSKVFTAIGEFTTQGLGDGILNLASYVAKSAKTVGETAITAVKKSISGLADVVSTDIDVTPTIRPVLDLSAIKKDATMITGMLGAHSISVDKNYESASAVAVARRASQQSAVSTENETVVASAAGPNVTFIQNNSSPKTLSNAEIYRQTKNQLSKAKGELTP